ncbi:MAG: anaerobic ribonucleoside-triphosphate reductase activating protein [Patescibacteria group bacterium]|nr:anaerobic ribonucleoside-triphosphate reductase activating protein [Patescibacteria group bacterium]
MIIGGLQKFSLLDYPEYLSAIIFTQGCNFRCQFCYNPMFVWPEKAKTGKITAKSNNTQDQKGHSPVSEDDLFAFLKTRTGKLDALVITGGEPTLHADLPDFIVKIKKLGFKIKLDTNGTNPEMVSRLIEERLIDYIAMDIKATDSKHEATVGVKVDLNNIKKSIKIIMKSSLPYEFRTTVVPELFAIEDVAEIGQSIKGASKWYLQKFQAESDLVNPDFEKQKSFTSEEMKAMRDKGRKYVDVCEVR